MRYTTLERLKKIVPHDLSFLEHLNRSAHTRHQRQGVLRKILFWGAIVLFVWMVVFGLAALEVFANATDGVKSLRLAKTDALQLHFRDATESLNRAESSFKQAKRFFPILATAHGMPFIGSPVKQAEALILAGGDVVVSLKSVCEIGENVLELSGLNEDYLSKVAEGLSPKITFSDLPPDTKQMVLARLQVAAGQFTLMSNRLSVAQTELDELSTQKTLGSFSGIIKKTSIELAQTQEVLDRVSRFANLIPAFSGINGTNHFLILFLNNAELRPAGGFAGNYGIMTVSKGNIESIKTADVYALDRASAQTVTEPAPYPLQKYNETPLWFFRDANWSPDWSISAKKFIETFLRESNSLAPDVRMRVPSADKIDGVIAFTPTFAADLLRITGPVTVDGQTFTPENIFEKLEYQVEQGFAKQGIPESQRKEVIGDLLQSVVADLSHIPLSDWSRVGFALEHAFQSRQFFAYHTNLNTETVLSKVGWAGNYTLETPDVQMLVDANLASLKTDPVVDRNIKYELFHNTSGDLVGRTTVAYTHKGSFDWKTSRYRTYARLYVPKGSQLIRVTGALQNDRIKNPKGDVGTADVSEELGMTVFGAFTSIEPGQTRALVFEYKIADVVKIAIQQGSYGLTVFKQNGAHANALTLDLNFGKNVLHATPPEDPKDWGNAHYRLNTTLDQDRTFEVAL